MRRVVATAIVVTAACLLVRPALAATAEEAGVVADVNTVRTSRGLRPLELHPELERKAQAWAAHLAAAGTLAHSTPTAGITVTWLSAAENVALAATTGEAEQALLSSSAHYANIVDPDLTHIGVGVAASGGQVYLVEEFMQLATTPATIAPPKPAAPVAAAAPAPRAIVAPPRRPQPAPTAPAVAPRSAEPAPTAPPALPSATPDRGDAVPPATAPVPESPALSAAPLSTAGPPPAPVAAPRAGQFVAGLFAGGTFTIVGRTRFRRKPR